MTCEHCGQFFEPGQNSDMIQGGCPGCNQPLRNRQPGDVGIENQLQQNMPAPGETDMGGNPLKEGILADGGWQNRQKRDESFASVRSSWNDSLKPKLAWVDEDDEPLESIEVEPVEPIQAPQTWLHSDRTSNQLPYNAFLAGEDPDFEIEDVEAPDAKSVKDKDLKKAIKEFEKQAGLFGTVWNGLKNVGQFAWQHPVEAAALGAGAVATGGAALPEEAAIVGGGLAAGEAGAGLAAGEAGAGLAGAGDAAAGLSAADKAKNAASWMGGAMKSGVGGLAKAEGTSTLFNQGTGMLMGGGGQAPAGAGGSPDARSIQQITHTKTADDFESPSSHGEIPKNRDGDSNVKTDGDTHEWQKDYSQADGGAAAHGTEALSVAFSPDTEAAYEMMFPLINHFHNSEEDGSQHPLMQALHQLMEADLPGYLEHGDHGHDSAPHDPLQADPTTENHKEDNTDATDSQIKQTNVVENAPGVAGGVPSLTQPIPQLPGAGPNNSKCMNGHTVDPSAQTCPQCGAAVMRGPGADGHNLVQPELQAMAALGDPSPEVNPYIGEPDIPAGMQMGDYRTQRNVKGVFEQCPNCGMKNMMGDPVCRGCNMNLDSQRTASDHQGPHTPEQMAAVSQLLQQQQRGDEIPNMILQPWDYADELAQISHNPDVPDGEQQGSPAPPPQPDPNSQGMPMPGMTAPGPGAGAPAPMMMGSSVTAADSVAKKCPKCDSHTTALVSQEDGTSICHSCGHVYKTPNLVGDDGHSTDLTTAALRQALDHMRPNFEGVPAADQKQQEDPDREQDSTLTWKDESGEPLKVGQQYKMKSKMYDIPDIVRIEAVRPESIEYSIVGEYGIAGNTKVTFLEAQQDGLSFQTFGSDPSQERSFDIEQNDDDQTQREQGGMETSDLSSPHQTLAATNPDLDWLREDGDFIRTAGARFTPTEQREFIEESGEARNREKLQLAGTHYESSLDEDYFLFGL